MCFTDNKASEPFLYGKRVGQEHVCVSTQRKGQTKVEKVKGMAWYG